MVTITRWTGKQARILREVALRMTIYEFAEHANLSTSTIRDMENKGEQAQLRTSTQKILDETLADAPEHAQQRFAAALTDPTTTETRWGATREPAALDGLPQPRHPPEAGLVATATRPDAKPPAGSYGAPLSTPPDQRDLVEDDQVDRRNLLSTSGVAVAAAVLLSPAMEAVGAVAKGLISHDASRGPDQPVEYSALARAAAHVKRAYQAGDHQGVLAKLPDLLAAARAAADGGLGSKEQQVAADIYQTACSVLLKLGEAGLALLAADRSTAAAARSGDPVAIGASTRALAHAVAANGHASRAVTMATAGAQQLDQTSGLSAAPQLAVYGALLLRGSILAAEGEDRATSLVLIAEAHETAGRIDGDDNTYGTYFCAQNVQLHHLSVAVRLGDAGQAVEHARKIDPGQIRLGERRASYFLDLAEAFTQWGKYHKAFDALREAEHVAPQELALRPASHELVADLLHRCPPSLHRPLRQLAGRIGALA